MSAQRAWCPLSRATGAARLGPAIVTINISGLRSKTKYLKQVINDNYCDFVFLQETNIQDDYTRDVALDKLGFRDGIFAYPNQHSCGSAIIQTSTRWDIIRQHSGFNGRLTHVDITNKTCSYSLINIYAPSEPTTRPDFYEELDRYIRKNTTHTLILGGDFNITLEEKDITGRKGPRREGRGQLQQLVNTHHLIDAYRTLFSDTVVTTYTNTDKKRASRIDRFYIHTTIKVQSCKHIQKTLDFTDHKAVHVTLGQIPPPDRTNTYWKFNDTLLNDNTFVDGIKLILNKNYDNVTKTNDKVGYYCALLDIVRKLAQQVGYSNKYNNKKNISLLECILKEANTDPYSTINNTEEQVHAQTLLDELQTNIYRGAQVRSKLLELDNEQPNATFLKLENNIQGTKDISQLQDTLGNITTDPAEITHIFEDFYRNLYGRERTDSAVQDSFLRHCRSVDNTDRDLLEAPFSKNEIEAAIGSLNKDSSPGPDGFTSKFYMFFNNELVRYLEIVFMNIYTNKQLPITHQMSYITLLPKDSGSLLLPKNYRPISLLNTEYKVLTSMLAKRISPHLETLVHPDQT